MTPLNPYLHRQLLRRFGHVKLCNQGESMVLSLCPDWSSGRRRLKPVVISWGETYRVSCPFCTDTRFRLYINHRWAERDERTGDDMLFAATCFNESCLAKRENQKRLHAVVYPEGRWADVVDPPLVKPVTPVTPATSRSIILPAGALLDDLHPYHPARRYLQQRGLDPERLAREYGVRYCDQCLDARPLLREPRLVIPIYELSELSRPRTPGLRLAGWQARVVGSAPDGIPKYLTAAGMHKSKLLYGLPLAINTTGAVVIVEGITDVWKIGGAAMAVLGKTISHTQCELLLRHFRGRPVIVWLDEDADADAVKMRDVVRTARVAAGDGAPVVVAHTPAGRDDPGACSSNEIMAVLQLSLGNAGPATIGDPR